jgi:hypothetical protein
MNAPRTGRLRQSGAAVALLAAVVGALAACQPRRDEPKLPAPRADETAPATGRSANPAPVPGQGADVATPRPESGMVGGASGPEASGGKPGTGTRAGGGTGATVESGDRTKAPR